MSIKAINFAKCCLIVLLAMMCIFTYTGNVEAAEAKSTEMTIVVGEQSAAYIVVGIDFSDGVATAYCYAYGDSLTETLSILCIFREENAYGGMNIVDTWREDFDGEYGYTESSTTAIDGRKYELSVSVTCIHEDGTKSIDYDSTQAQYTVPSN